MYYRKGILDIRGKYISGKRMQQYKFGYRSPTIKIIGS